MQCVDFVALVIISFELKKMVDYLWRYAVFKFDVEMISCSIHAVWFDFVEINNGFMLLVACWVVWCIQLQILEKKFVESIGEVEGCVLFPETLVHVALPRILNLTRCMVL